MSRMGDASVDLERCLRRIREDYDLDDVQTVLILKAAVKENSRPFRAYEAAMDLHTPDTSPGTKETLT